MGGIPVQHHEDDGLQAVDHNNYPEVVPESAPEVTKPGSSDGIESYTVAAHYARPNEKSPALTGYYGDATLHDSEQQPPRYSNIHDGQHSGERRILGMKRKVFFIVLGVTIVVILAAVLGGVLGSVLGKSKTTDDASSGGSSSNTTTPSAPASNSSARAMTGLAAASYGSISYTYYIDTNKQIVEQVYANGPFGGSSNVTTTVISNSGPSSNSPLAAVAWMAQGEIVVSRAIFYFDTNGLLTTQNATGDATWLQPYTGIASNLASQSSATSIAACVGTSGTTLNGIRVYYGAPLSSISQGFIAQTNLSAGSNVASGYIQEVGMNFPDSNPLPFWHIWAAFNGTDGRSGVDCALVSDDLHLYTRNVSTGSLQQYSWNYATAGPWLPGVQPSSNLPVAVSGSIAAATDGSASDYIFYQTGNTTASVVQFGGSAVSSVNSISQLSETELGYPLAATWYPTGSSALLMSQSLDTPADLLFSGVTRSGQTANATTAT